MLKKKMAFIDLSNFHDWPMGGMLEYELAILEGLVKRFEIDIWGVSVDGIKPAPIKINGKEYNVNVFANVKTKNKIIPNYLRGMFIYGQKKIMKGHYDYYYAHTASCLVGIGFFEKNAKLIYHQHGLNYLQDHSLMQSIQRPFYTKAQKDADLVFVVSDTKSVKKYESMMKHKHHISAKYVSVRSPIRINNFDALRVQKRIDSSKNVDLKNFIYTGRLSKFKNAKLLVEVFKEYVKDINPKAKLTIVGSGEEAEDIEQKINNYDLKGKVKMLGAVKHDKIYDLLMTSDAFLTASGGEGVSVSVAEAYAAGLPVVCFNVPGLSGQVVDGVTGKIAFSQTEAGFFDAMKYVNDNHTELALNCMEAAKKYDSEKISNLITEKILSL
ncbi:Glycosyl transferase [Lactobacillus delbrueckii subsp. bulgaricus ND02]|nr:Glycosyl transferase [Lactobacillus delbrueckii subsp. bulgaricus ND02]